MKIEDEIKILNNLLDNIGVKGFSFIHKKYYLTIKIPDYNYPDYCLIGCWFGLDDLFKHARISHSCGGHGVEYIIQNIIKTHSVNSNLGYAADYLNINDTGLDFLKCLINSSSMTNLLLKLQLMGYEYGN
jgi:hypothetical protein